MIEADDAGLRREFPRADADRAAMNRYSAAVRRRRFTSLLLASLLACKPGVSSRAEPQTPQAKTIYIVRHAEKQHVDGERDPELTEAGHGRAAALRERLATVKLDAIFSSNYRRTLQTVAPLVDVTGLDITLYDPAAPAADFAESLRASPATQLLIAGHSNTIPTLLAALGATIEPIDEGRYGDLFIVTLQGDAVDLRVERFGS